MKRIRIAMVAAFVFAIGSAFVTKASVKPFAVAYQQLPGVCQQITSNCNTSGSVACGATVYSSRTSPSTCDATTILSQKDN
jgi:hypothetical protein